MANLRLLAETFEPDDPEYQPQDGAMKQPHSVMASPLREGWWTGDRRRLR